MAFTLECSGKKVTFQPLPEEVAFSDGTTYATYRIIGEGDVAYPSGTEISEVSFEVDMFGKKLKSMVGNPDEYIEPHAAKKLIKKWQDGKKVCKLILANDKSNLKFKDDVTIAKCEAVEHGSNGNIRFSLTFHIDEDVSVKAMKKKKSSGSGGGKGGGREDNDSGRGGGAALRGRKSTADQKNSKLPTTYTVKSGDTLWAIAKKHYGDGKSWKKIYDKNKSAIESAAKKHGKKSSDTGHWIYPGTKLTIPKS